MEGLTRLVTESLLRHGFDRPVDYRRLAWSPWFRCDSVRSLLLVPSKPGVFAIAEEVGNNVETDAFVRPAGQSPALVRRTTDAHVGTAALGCPAEQSSAVFADAATTSTEGKTREGRDFSRAVISPPMSVASAARPATRRMLAVLQFGEAEDIAFVLDRTLTRQNPLRDRLASGRCFVRFVVIEDTAQRRSICTALNQWILSSSEKASGIGAHFASSLELSVAPQLDSGATSNLHHPTPLPSGF